MSDQRPKLPKTFLGKAYVRFLESRTYGLFRDLEVETDMKGVDGLPIREKVKSIGPLKILREAEDGEEQIVVLRTVEPGSGRDIGLVELT